MIVHLLHELPRELDRLDVGPERAAEDPFEQALDLGLDAAQQRHVAGGIRPRDESSEPVLGGDVGGDGPDEADDEEPCRPRSGGRGRRRTSAAPIAGDAVAGAAGRPGQERGGRRGHDCPADAPPGGARARSRAASAISPGRVVRPDPERAGRRRASGSVVARDTREERSREHGERGLGGASQRSARMLHDEGNERQEAERREQRPGDEEEARTSRPARRASSQPSATPP